MWGLTSPRARIRGCFLGGAVGDALGEPVEFLDIDQIRSKLGPRGVTEYTELAASPGAFTDDTQMTLFTAEGLIRAMQRWDDRGIVNATTVVWMAYLRWLETQGSPAQTDGPSQRGYLVDVPELRKRMAPGATCIAALRSGVMGTVDRPINDSKGCGGVMRVAPVGLIANEPFRLGMDIAATTHTHPAGYIAAGALSLIISKIVQGEELSEAVAAAIESVGSKDDGDETREALEHALAAAREGAASVEAVESLGGGWVAEEALAISVYCSLTADDFRHGVLTAVNHSGDSDSTGSITGQILGTRFGDEAIPPEWVDGLQGRTVVERVASDFARCFLNGETLDFDDYPPN